MTRSERLSRLATWLYWACATLAWLLPVLLILRIVQGVFDPAQVAAGFDALPAGTPIAPLQGTLAAALAVLAVFPLVGALQAMARLFDRYRRGETLTFAAADDILRIGRALTAVAAVSVLVPTAQLLVLSWRAGPGGRILSVALDDGTLGFLLAGATLTAIGWVMREAAAVAEENRGFV